MNDGTNETPGVAPWATVCLNCGAALDGRFCARCGQRAIPPDPTVRELAGDAWNELVGWDGRLLRTIRLLVRHPGELTRAVIDGRRAQYVSPVRLYLACSVLYFLAAAAAPIPAAVSFEAGVGVGAPERTSENAAIEKAMARGFDSLTPEERAAVEAEIAKQPAVFRPTLRSVARDYPGVRRRIGETLPRALFVLVPVLAIVFGLFYRRRHYPEHLYAALHLQTFVFLVLTFASVADYTQSLVVRGAAIVGASLVIVTHAVLAQRRVYAESWPKTVVKAVCVAALYGALWGATSFGVVLWVARD
jgi:hypothetical protein